jgi:hypothetical protein
MGAYRLTDKLELEVAGRCHPDIPLGHKDDPWALPHYHFDTLTISVADATTRRVMLVVIAIGGCGRLRYGVSLRSNE